MPAIDEAPYIFNPWAPGEDFAAGAALGAIGVIYVGQIPADLSQPYTPPPGWEWGFGIVPAPDPATYVTPHPAGGPEDQPPPVDFDTPPPPPPPPVPPTPVEAGGDIDYEFQGDNPLVPTLPGEPGPPEQPVYAGPPVIFQPGPPDPLEEPPLYASGAEGGPEDTATPPEFDTPLPSAAPPPADVPVVVPPPLEGEMVNPDVIYHDYEGYDQLPGFGDIGDPPKRIIEGETINEPIDALGRIIGAVARAILGPYGSAIGPALAPEVLGSGELPFPAVPTITLPEPAPITFPEPTLGTTPDLGMPVFGQLPVPDVIVVTPSSPVYQPQPTRSSQTLPSPSPTRAVWPIVGALIGLDLLPRFASTPLTGLGTLTLTSDPPAPIPPATMTAEDQCNCDNRGQQRKRKKPRKCLTRANVIWASGPKKGQFAGSRCVKFEDFFP